MKESAIEKNTGELINPLPDTIPNIVWDDLLYSDKEEILNAVKLNYTVTYYHTERRHKTDFTTAVSIYAEDTYVDSSSDTDVIEIKEIDARVKKSGICLVSRIYSRATSERGIIKFESPVPDIIPCNIWNNLPDVLKENIIKAERGKNKDSVLTNNVAISYNPDEDTITIHIHSGFNSYTDIYDAKRGVGIGGYVSMGN